MFQIRSLFSEREKWSPDLCSLSVRMEKIFLISRAEARLAECILADALFGGRLQITRKLSRLEFNTVRSHRKKK